MASSNTLVSTFFHELKQYNSTNFKAIEQAVLTAEDAAIYKAFSSVVTRYFIFCEKHPEVSTTDKRILFFQLKIDMIARYFSEYPDTNIDQLKAFQFELQNYVKQLKGGETIE